MKTLRFNHVFSNTSTGKIQIPSDCLAPQHKLFITDLKMHKQQRQHRMWGPVTVRVKWSKLPDHKEMLTHGITFHPVTQGSVDATWLGDYRSMIDTAKRVLSMDNSGRPFIDKQIWLWTEKGAGESESKDNIKKLDSPADWRSPKQIHLGKERSQEICCQCQIRVLSWSVRAAWHQRRWEIHL